MFISAVPYLWVHAGVDTATLESVVHAGAESGACTSASAWSGTCHGGLLPTLSELRIYEGQVALSECDCSGRCWVRLDEFLERPRLKG